MPAVNTTGFCEKMLRAGRWQRQNHTSGKPNAAAHAEMMKHRCSKTNLHVMTHSVEHQILKLNKQTGRRKPDASQLQHVARKVKKRDTNMTEWPWDVHSETDFFSMPGHCFFLDNQRRPAHTSWTKPTTEAPEQRQHPHHSMIQSHPFRNKRMSKLTTTTESNKNLPLNKIQPQHFQAFQDAGSSQHWLPKLLCKLRNIPTMNTTEEEQHASALDIRTSGMNQSIQSSKLPKTNLTSNGWDWSVHVLHQICQPQRNVSMRSVQETDSRPDLPRLWTSTLQLQALKKWW